MTPPLSYNIHMHVYIRLDKENVKNCLSETIGLRALVFGMHVHTSGNHNTMKFILKEFRNRYALLFPNRIKHILLQNLIEINGLLHASDLH